MWHYKNEEEGIEVIGSRQEIKEHLNIFTVYFEDREEEELFDPYQPSHWAKIVEQYNLTGDDD